MRFTRPSVRCWVVDFEYSHLPSIQSAPLCVHRRGPVKSYLIKSWDSERLPYIVEFKIQAQNDCWTVTSFTAIAAHAHFSPFQKTHTWRSRYNDLSRGPQQSKGALESELSLLLHSMLMFLKHQAETMILSNVPLHTQATLLQLCHILANYLLHSESLCLSYFLAIRTKSWHLWFKRGQVILAYSLFRFQSKAGQL